MMSYLLTCPHCKRGVRFTEDETLEEGDQAECWHCGAMNVVTIDEFSELPVLVKSETEESEAPHDVP